MSDHLSERRLSRFLLVNAALCCWSWSRLITLFF